MNNHLLSVYFNYIYMDRITGDLQEYSELLFKNSVSWLYLYIYGYDKTYHY